MMTGRAGYEIAGGSFSRLLGSSKYSDLKLIVGPDKDEILVHKNIVCSASSYIDRLCAEQIEAVKKAISAAATKAASVTPFEFGAPPKPPVIPVDPGIVELHLPRIPKKIMEHILSYMYGQDFELFEKIGMDKIDVFYAAHELEMDDLKYRVVKEYTRLFKEKEGIWNPQHIMSVIGIVIETEYNGLSESDYRAQKCHPAVSEMLNALLNFVDLQDVLYGDEFQYLISDIRIALWEKNQPYASKVVIFLARELSTVEGRGLKNKWVAAIQRSRHRQLSNLRNRTIESARRTPVKDVFAEREHQARRINELAQHEGDDPVEFVEDEVLSPVETSVEVVEAFAEMRNFVRPLIPINQMGEIISVIKCRLQSEYAALTDKPFSPPESSQLNDYLHRERQKARTEFSHNFRKSPRKTAEFRKQRPSDFPVHVRIFPLLDEPGLDAHCFSLMNIIMLWQHNRADELPDLKSFESIAEAFAEEVPVPRSGGRYRKNKLLQLAKVARNILEDPEETRDEIQQPRNPRRVRGQDLGRLGLI
ncbi:hypothetical protein TWF696_007315 [Orbilia brochopaga]|uniref:BTB domain-containing protein n=1 Tax=Orbilia brochopaga TaxID=3140254 RepID=A0AAV9URL4_9PEZI